MSEYDGALWSNLITITTFLHCQGVQLTIVHAEGHWHMTDQALEK